MDQSLKSPGHSALEDAFHTMFDASRADPAPACDVRIDRLR
jgi:coniferyl-aldehyde dehydrogenase